MKKTSRLPFLHLDMMMLPKNSRSAIFNDELVLSDNLNNGLNGLEQQGPSLLNYPIKMTFNFIILCVKGRVDIQLNLKRYTLQDNDILCALKGDIGEYYGISNGDESTQVVLIAYADEYFPSNDVVGIQQLFRENSCFTLQSCQKSEIMTIYQLMKSSIEDKVYPNYEKGALAGYMQALIYRVCTFNASWMETRVECASKSDRKQNIFNDFIKLVRANYTKERGIRFYADQLCLTPKYFSNIIFRTSGRYAGEWINDYVILEAKALLKTQKYTVSQISDMLNFANPSFFGQYFKRNVGCSPAEYQKIDTGSK